MLGTLTFGDILVWIRGRKLHFRWFLVLCRDQRLLVLLALLIVPEQVLTTTPTAKPFILHRQQHASGRGVNSWENTRGLETKKKDLSWSLLGKGNCCLCLTCGCSLCSPLATWISRSDKWQYFVSYAHKQWELMYGQRNLKRIADLGTGNAGSW